MHVSKAVLLLMLIGIAAGCGSSPTSSTPPPPPAPPSPTVLANFTDPKTSFSTQDVREAQRQIVRFDVSTNSLIWTLTGQKFTGYPVSGNSIGSDRKFQVAFGMEDGEHRAYFTEAATGTICDIEVLNGQLVILPTSQTVPGGG